MSNNEFAQIELKKSSKGKLVINRLGDIYKVARYSVFAELELAIPASVDACLSYHVDEDGKSVINKEYDVKWLEFDKDAYETPQFLFNWLDSRFKFDIDGCASSENAKCDIYFTDSEVNFLNFDLKQFEQKHGPARFFVNPPYSDVGPYLQRAKKLRDAGHLVVFLLNADKSTTWFENDIKGQANEVIDITGGRISFLHPVTKEEAKGNSKWQMVVVFDPGMDDYVTRSVSLKFIEKNFNYGN